MYKKYIAIFLCALSPLLMQAQTLEQLARDAFMAGDYAKAKPMLKKCLRTAPKDTRINYWYGASCIETGDIEEAYSYLQFAVDHNVQNAYRYMGRYYYLMGNYDAAAENIENYLSIANPDDALYAENQEFLQKIHAEQRFFRRVEKVTFVDSMVVAKDEFLENYLLGHEAGSLYRCGDDGSSSDAESNPEGIAYSTELANKIFFSRPNENGQLELLSTYKMTEEWSTPAPLEGLPDTGDSNYPFMLSDGITFYYANNGENSIGGYDIFVTRYNSETGRFLKSDNVGMPFNSMANDYMMAIDELNGLGWFATDRRQQEGFVCIYIFVWDDGKKSYYDTDEISADTIRRAADIISIAETQFDADAVRRAHQSLFQLNLSESTPSSSSHDFIFVLDDFTDYHSLSDFHSEEARATYSFFLECFDEIKADEAKLESLRIAWASAKDTSREDLTKEILAVEQHLVKLVDEVKQLEMKARNEEKNYHTK